MILSTERLILREMTVDDLPSLSSILQDAEVMYAYEHAFSNEEVRVWLNKQILRYEKDGFGLWAVVLKGNGQMIGQCGLTRQECFGKEVVEVGYLFNKTYWHNGYAGEAAIACKEYAFNVLNEKAVYSIIRDNNIASMNVAIKNGMSKVGEFDKVYYNIIMPHYVFEVKNSFKKYKT